MADRVASGIVGFGLVLALLAPASVGAAPLDAVQADRVRIREHLAGVEQRLRSAPVDHLPPPVRQARARSLDELHRYWQAGAFPHNSRHPGQRRPYFIDDEGRACAVGALIQRSGYEALARRIDEMFHNAYVPDMLDAELLAWAGAHGFSVAELALIQPEYCACGTGFDADGGAGGQGGAATDPAAYRPVCGSNGLTYWNACIAEVCGGVQIAADGECAHEPPCELCGTGSRYVAVAECTQDAPEGICDLDFESEVVPVSDKVAARWLELQGRACQAPDYVLPSDEEESGWQSARPPGSVPPRWDCVSSSGGAPSSGGASSGAPMSGGAGTDGGGSDVETPSQGGQASSEPDAAQQPAGGCACATARGQGWSAAPLALLALGLLRHRRAQRLKAELPRR
jgi:MYXO-CTERM domain-containing protein